ncbi:MAG: DUF3644 domain-containing protein [Flavobacteriales bacterium]
MGRKKTSAHLRDKSLEAALSAIELYNKPNFSYREEGFCILMINAWELMLKAKVLSDHSEDKRRIYIEDEQARRRDGEPYKRKKYKKSKKTGNPLTLGIPKLVNAIEGMDNTLREHIVTLNEIRNNCIHFIVKDRSLQKKIVEVGTASLKSYVHLSREWFGKSLEDFNLYLIPIAFDPPSAFDTTTPKEQQRLLDFIEKEKRDNEVSEDHPHHISLNISIKYTSGKTGILFSKSKAGGMPITVKAEAQFKNKFRWTFDDNLIPALKKYGNFKRTKEFYRLKRELERDENLAGVRYLDWNKKENGTKKIFYSPNIVEAFVEKLGLTRQDQSQG